MELNCEQVGLVKITVAPSVRCPNGILIDRINRSLEFHLFNWLLPGTAIYLEVYQEGRFVAVLHTG